MNALARASKQALQTAARGFASGAYPDRKVAVLGAAGEPLRTVQLLATLRCMQLRQCAPGSCAASSRAHRSGGAGAARRGRPSSTHNTITTLTLHPGLCRRHRPAPVAADEGAARKRGWESPGRFAATTCKPAAMACGAPAVPQCSQQLCILPLPQCNSCPPTCLSWRCTILRAPPAWRQM